MVRAGGGARVSMCPSFTPPLSPAVAAAVALARPPRPGPRNHPTGAAGTGRAPGGSRAGAPPEPRGRAAQPTAAAVGQLRPGGRAGAAAMAGQGRAGGGGAAPAVVPDRGLGKAAAGPGPVREGGGAGSSVRAPASLPFYGIGWLGGWAFCGFIFSRQEERFVWLKRPNGAVVVSRHRVSRRKRRGWIGREGTLGVFGAFCWRFSKIKLLVEK